VFNGEESTRFKTDLPYRRVLDEIEEALDVVGRIEIDEAGELYGSGQQAGSFADVKFEGWLERSKGGGQYELVVEYRINPGVVAILLAIFLFPAGLIIAAVVLSNSQNEMRSSLRRAFHDLKDALREG
jgi:hypothetical protein